jgi:hypothetical protein
MAHYAMVVVVEDDHDEEVRRLIMHSNDGIMFVGDPWEVTSEVGGEDLEFDTLSVIEQHPET